MKDLTQLFEDMKTNEALRAKIVAVGDDEAAVDAALADEGYAVTAADIKEYAEQTGQGEPSEDDLRRVAGGGVVTDAVSITCNIFIGTGSAWC